MNGVRMMTGKRSAIVAGLVIFPALAACGGGEEAAATEQAAAAPQVVVLGAEDVAIAKVSDVAPTVLLTGTLEPLRKAEVKSQAPGTITELRVDRGERVSAGQTLATISAQGIVSQAAGAAAAVSGAQANLALAQRQLDSSKRLYEAGAGSEMDFRAAQAQVAAARSQVAAARAQATGASESAARTRVTSPISGVVSERVVNPGEAV
ncbi:MAG TPA: efflux RND transporter periplasmic adaptor subunit, partial [Longimicrobium sp.]